MGVRTSWQVDISCDGTSHPCPGKSQFKASVPVSASLRLAGRAGWDLTDLALCPTCSSGELPAAATAGQRPPGAAGHQALHPRRAA